VPQDRYRALMAGLGMKKKRIKKDLVEETGSSRQRRVGWEIFRELAGKDHQRRGIEKASSRRPSAQKAKWRNKVEWTREETCKCGLDQSVIRAAAKGAKYPTREKVRNLAVRRIKEGGG